MAEEQKLKCWKQHTCYSCGAVYRYQIERSAGNTIFGSGEENALAKLKVETDKIPCPTCGLLQPEMIAPDKIKPDMIIGGAAFLLALIFVAVGFGAKSMSPADAAQACAGIAGAALLAHLVVMFLNPNSKRAHNKMRANDMIRSGSVQLVTPGSDGNMKPPPRLMTVGHLIAFLFIGAGAFGFIHTVDEIKDIKLPDGGKFMPGGKVRLTFPEKVQCVKGLYNGGCEVMVLNAEEVGAPTKLVSGCQQARWQDEIQVTSTQEAVDTPLYVDVFLPDDPKLDGKTLELKVDLRINYPYRTRVGEIFEEGEMEVSMTRSVTLQGELYRRLNEHWGRAAMFGMFGLVCGSLLIILLDGLLKRKALPTRLDPIE